MKLLKVGMYDEVLCVEFQDYINTLPKSIKTGTLLARLLAWYMDQPAEFKKQFEYLPDKSKGGRTPGSKDSGMRIRRTKAELDPMK